MTSRRTNPIKVAIIGAGFMGVKHAAVYQILPETKLTAVADVREDVAKNLAREYGAKPYVNVDSLIKNEEIELVDICLPTFLHPEYVIKAAQHGKHILCEKPIALRLEDADQMIEETEKAKVKFMVAQILRFQPEYVMLRDIVNSNELGDLISITCGRMGPPPDWGWQNWFLNPDKSGSPLIDLHIHDVDYLFYLLGKPSSIFSQASHRILPYGHIFTTFAFSSGIVAYSEAGLDLVKGFPFTAALTAVLEKGVVEFTFREKPTLLIYKEGKVESLSVRKKLPLIKEMGGNVAGLSGYWEEIEYFVDCIRKNKPSDKAKPRSVRNSLAIALAIRESIDSVRIVKGEEIKTLPES